MSEPARLFQSLHIDDMPVTRSQAQSSSQRGGRNPRSSRGRGRGRGPQPASTTVPPIHPPVEPVHSYTGRQYYTQALSPMSAQRAIEGLESNFSVDLIQNHDSGRDRYFAFQLRTPVAVRIYEPNGLNARVECSCEAHRVTQSECPHIYWLFAGLHAVFANREIAATQAPTPMEISLTSQLGGLYPMIEQHQSSLRQDLNRFSVDDMEPESASPAIQNPFSTFDFETKRDTLCDILSTFDCNLLPSEFKEHFVDDPPPELSPIDGGELIQDSLTATIFRMALRDDTLYRRLQQVVPPDVRATQYYKTQYGKARSALQSVSRFAEFGPTAQQRVMDVPSCARYLRSIVHAMCEDRKRRTEVAPLGTPVLSRLAETLTRLVGQVVSLDRNIYAQRQSNRIQPPEEHARDRNLFAYLIGDPPQTPGLPQWLTDHFVFDRLQSFPSSEWKHLLELFTTIKDAIEEKDMDAFPGSFDYVATIENMVREYTASTNEPSSSSVQVLRRA